jgi:hydroxymethylpyrimidine pyrophosphatase-like HAD family hydrolase
MVEALPDWKTYDVEAIRAFGGIRLIALDLDGTLIESPTASVYRPILGLRLSLASYRVAVTVATGRTLAGISRVLNELQLPRGVPVILYNGSVVIRRGIIEPMIHRTIPADTLRRVVRASFERGFRVLSYSYGRRDYGLLRGSGEQEWVTGWSRRGGPPYEFNGMEVSWSISPEIVEGLEASAVLVEAQAESKERREVYASLSRLPGISVTESGTSYLEIRPKASNKASALRAVARWLGVKRSQVMAVGDHDNDAEMLWWAGIGVAVAGASEKAVGSSRYVCRYGAARGAIETLRIVRKAHRYFDKGRSGAKREG